MTYFSAIILGIVEGLTEFIPVSSSGHLIIAHHFLGAGPNDLAIDAVIQMGTILAVPIYFWKDLWKIFFDFCKIVTRKPVEQKDRTMVWAIVLGTIPAVIFGLLLEKTMATLFRNVHLVAVALLLGSALMFIADKYARAGKTLTVRTGIVVGFYQCLALLPGFSRSGATISGGLLQGLNREEATRFSFLMAFPVIFGAGMKEFFGLAKTGLAFTAPLALSTVVAFLVGLWSIGFLLRFLRTHNLNLFVWYRVLVAILILVLI